VPRAPVSWYRRLPRVLLAVLIGFALVEGALRSWGFVYLAASRRRADVAGERAGALIACLGDSNVFGIFTEAAESYPAELERLLAARGEPGARVLNLGVPGTSTLHVVRDLPRVIDEWRPDAVLVTAGVNNAWTWVGDATTGADGPPWYAELRLLKLVAALGRTLGGGDAGSGAAGGALSKGSPLDEAERVQSIRRDLERAQRIADERGTPLILVGYAADERGYAEANRTLRAHAQERGAALADPVPAVRELQALHGKEALFFPDLHPRAPGYAAVARAAYNELVALGLVRGEIIDPCEGIGAQGAGTVRLSLTGGADGLALVIAGGPPGAPFRAVAYGLRPRGPADPPPFEELDGDALFRALRGRLNGRLDARGEGSVALPSSAFLGAQSEPGGAQFFCAVFFEPACEGERPAPPVGPVRLELP
jgi:lysophospholipase L1-like esterase